MKAAILAPVIIAVFVVGCAKQPQYLPLYNYEDYGKNYYAYKKNMNPETTAALMQSIEKTTQEAEKSSSKRVPPGMYANLGYMYLKASKPNEAIANFTKEKAVYPESTLFMNRMINKVQALEENKK